MFFVVEKLFAALRCANILNLFKLHKIIMLNKVNELITHDKINFQNLFKQ